MPKVLNIENKKIFGYLKDKDTLVKEGRKISQTIDDIQSEIMKLEADEREITGKVEPKELIEEGTKLQVEINASINKLEKLAKKIEQEKLDAIPADIKKKHLALIDKKQEKERERNKVALKVQKIKDRVVPMIKKEVTPHLEQYEDIETAVVKGQKVEIQIFSHLEQWKAAFTKK